MEIIDGERRVATTRAGDGYERRAFTADEIWRMQELGIIDDSEGFGIREYLVIDTKKLTTKVQKAPVDCAWGSIETLAADAVLTHASAPDFAIRLADL